MMENTHDRRSQIIFRPPPPRIYVLVAASLLILLFSASPVYAATITVSGNCSLAEAIENANNGDQTNNDCATGSSGADTITLSGNVNPTERLPDITSDITIVGGGFTINQQSSSNLFGGALLRTLAGSNLTLQNLTLYYGGGGGTGADPEAALQLGDAATLTNVTFQACYRICVRGTNSEATYTFETVLFIFGLGAYYTPAAIWAEAGTYNLTNTGFRNFRNGGESLIRVDSGARVTLNGCLYIFAVLPKLKSGNGRLTNNSSGNCVGTTIGNNYAVDDIPDEETVEEDCGLYEGWPVMSVSKTVTRNVVLTGDCDIRRGPTDVPHNLNLRVSSPAGERYTIRCNVDNQCFTVGGRLTLRNVNLEGRNTDPPPSIWCTRH